MTQMADQALIEKIHEAVIDTRLEDALYELKKVATDFDQQNTIILLISQLKEAEREQMLDTEDERVIGRKINRIRLGVQKA